MFRRLLLVSLFLLLTVSAFVKASKLAKANTILLQDNFNTSSINIDKWSLSNFAVEESGTYSPFGELSIVPTEGELMIAGTKSNTDTVTINGITAGNLGRALVTKNNLQYDNNIDIEVKTKIINGDIGYELIVFVEFDSNNRIVFNLQKINEGKFAQLVFEEADNIRCPLNNEVNGCLVLPYNFSDDYINLKLTLEHNNNKISAFVNGNLVAWGIFTGNFSSLKTGIATTERVPNRFVDSRFDDFKVITDSVPSPAPSQELNVPDVKQFTSPWGSQEYDFASSWYPKNPTISRWGCALTSATMVLNYYGSSVNPESLNNWLKTNNGYTRNGGVLWPSVSKYSQLDPSIPTLEFAYLNYSDDLFKNEISQNRPPILKLENSTYGGNHFIVGKGFNDHDLFVNDPGSKTNTTLNQTNSYWGNVLKLGRFKPSNTDLSYLVLAVDDGFSLKFFDTNGNEIEGNDFSFKEGPMMDPDDPTEDSGVGKLKVFYFPKPPSGVYRIEVEGSGVYQLDEYVYDVLGNQKSEKIISSVQNGGKDIFEIDFDKNDSQKALLPSTDFSFESVLEDIENAYFAGQITSHDVYMSLRKQVENARKFFNKEKFFVSKIHLINSKDQLSLFTPTYINESASEKLIFKIRTLLDSFQ